MSDEYGKAIIHRDYEADTVRLEWEGKSNLTIITQELLNNADPRVLQRDGDLITIGGMRFRLNGRPGPYPHSWEIERLDG